MAYEVGPRKLFQELTGGLIGIWQALCYCVVAWPCFTQFYLSSMEWTELETERTFQPELCKELSARRGWNSKVRRGILITPEVCPHTWTREENSEHQLDYGFECCVWDSYCREIAQGNFSNKSSNGKPQDTVALTLACGTCKNIRHLIF